MRWLVGIDLRNLGAGAVEYARWLHARDASETFIGAHVVDFELRELFARVEPAPPDEKIPPFVDELLDPVRDDAAFTEVGSIPASAAEDGLTEAARVHRCDAMLIGRRKPMHESSMVRLGRVARRLLRTLPRPVVVVPPDAKVADFSDGPVLVATQLGASSEGAARFGAKLAESVDLDMLVTAVASVPDELSLLAGPDRARAIASDSVNATRTRLGDWVEAQSLADVRTSVVEGHVGPALLEVAKVSGASMIVVGSRGLSTFDRLMLSSVGSELAASAPVPVAVVPPRWPDLDSPKQDQ